MNAAVGLRLVAGVTLAAVVVALMLLQQVVARTPVGALAIQRLADQVDEAERRAVTASLASLRPDDSPLAGRDVQTQTVSRCDDEACRISTYTTLVQRGTLAAIAVDGVRTELRWLGDDPAHDRVGGWQVREQLWYVGRREGADASEGQVLAGSFDVRPPAAAAVGADLARLLTERADRVVRMARAR